MHNGCHDSGVLNRLFCCLDISSKCDPEELDLTHVMQTLANENIDGLPPGGGLSSK
jgi:hypothetical protein